MPTENTLETIKFILDTTTGLTVKETNHIMDLVKEYGKEQYQKALKDKLG